MARKPSDILSDPSGIEVNSLSDQSVLVSDWTVTLSEVNVQRFRCCREKNIARVSIARETVIFFLRRKCNLRYAWPCFQIYGNRVYQSEYIVLILICVHTYFRAKLTSKSSDIIIHFVRPKLKGIGHFVRRLCKKYFKACKVGCNTVRSIFNNGVGWNDYRVCIIITDYHAANPTVLFLFYNNNLI